LNWKKAIFSRYLNAIELDGEEIHKVKVQNTKMEKIHWSCDEMAKKLDLEAYLQLLCKIIDINMLLMS